MKKSFRQKLVAPCGMNCNVCSGYLALKCDLKSNGVRMSYCTGCRPRDKKCSFLKKTCNNLMNHTVQFCYECKEFPCEKLKQIDRRYKENFRMSLLKNLIDIKVNGMEKFLRTQEEIWQCQNCGGVICCHNGLCFQCDSESLKNKKKLYRWKDD